MMMSKGDGNASRASPKIEGRSSFWVLLDPRSYKVDENLRFRSWDEYVRSDLKFYAVEVGHTGDVLQWLVVNAALHARPKCGQLVLREWSVEIGVQSNPTNREYMTEQQLDRESRLVDGSRAEVIRSPPDDI
jgi:hypothetical protein